MEVSWVRSVKVDSRKERGWEADGTSADEDEDNSQCLPTGILSDRYVPRRSSTESSSERVFCSGICFFFPFFFEDGGGGGVGVALWLVVFVVSSRTSSKQTH